MREDIFVQHYEKKGREKERPFFSVNSVDRGATGHGVRSDRSSLINQFVYDLANHLMLLAMYIN